VIAVEGIEIKMTRTLPMQFLYDIMITMVETPVGGWWHFIDVNRDEDLNILNFTVVDIGDSLDGDHEEIMEAIQTADRHVITPEKVAEAIERVMCSPDHLVGAGIEDYIARGVREDDAGDIDAIAADCLLQIACLDEVVYG
jgi:hypothetical protein